MLRTKELYIKSINTFIPNGCFTGSLLLYEKSKIAFMLHVGSWINYKVL
jgi:hypothetical protein